MFYDKASCFNRSERTLFQTFIKCKGEWKSITSFAWILESLPGNPLLWLTHFWEIRANLKLFNRVYIFPRKQSFQLLTKKKNVSADHQQKICSFKLPVWQTGRYYCRVPDDPTLSLNTYAQPLDGSHIEWSLTFPQHYIIELSTLLVPKFVGL